MARKLEGRVRYDKDNDAFVYESRAVDEDKGLYEDWSMCLTCPCVRREGAEDGEDADYIHYSMLKQVVADVWNWGMSVRLA